MIVTQVSLDSDDNNRVDALAKNRRLSKSSMLRVLVVEGLKIEEKK